MKIFLKPGPNLLVREPPPPPPSNTFLDRLEKRRAQIKTPLFAETERAAREQKITPPPPPR